MVPTVLLTTGTSLATLSTLSYIKHIVQGKSKPRMITWAVWSVLLGLTAIVSWQAHQISSAVLSGVSAIGCFTIVLLTVRFVSFRLTRIERFTLLGAVIGVILWLVFDNPMLVLLTAVTVDAIAYLPTYINGWRHPHHESMTAFVISAIGSSLVLLAAVLAHANSSGLIYPLYSVVFGSIMVGILLTRRLKIS